jgi:hypothetical protein
VVKNYVTKGLGLYAEAEEHEKEIKVCQAQIKQYKQPELTSM